MTRKAKKVADAKPDAALNDADKKAATTRTPEQQAIIDADKAALEKVDNENNPPLPGPDAPGAPTHPHPQQSALDALKQHTLGNGQVDAPRRDPARVQRPHEPQGGDKVDNLATAFHADQDQHKDQVAAPLTRRERALADRPMSEEDRRRALLDNQQGVDTFSREAGDAPRGEPTLAECNAQFFKEEDHNMQRRVALKESVGDVLHEAFGPGGARRMQKDLR